MIEHIERTRLSRKAIIVIVVALTSVCVPALVAEAGTETVFHVALTGDDSNAGDEATPFASIERAQQSVRRLIAAGLSGDVEVIVHGGVYELAAPLVFTPQDSGTEKYSVTYKARPGDTVVISGGRRITNWSKGDGSIWTAEVPGVKEGNWYFRNLYVNDHRALRARSPNAGEAVPYYKLTGVRLNSDKTKWELKLAPGHVVDWKNLSDVEIVIIRQWEITRKRLQSVDPVSGTLVLQPPYIPSDSRIEPQAGYNCYLENARAFLDEPGEWYLDRSTGILSYWPRPNEDMHTLVTIAPRLTSLLEILGTASRPVRNLHVVGICFGYAAANLPTEGYVGNGCGFYRTVYFPTDSSVFGSRALGRIDDAIHLEFAHACSIEGGDITHVGGNALGIDRGCYHILISGNRFLDFGDNGVILGCMFPHQLDPAQQPRSNAIINNVIEDGGAEYNAGVGVLLLTAADSLVSHNLISRLPSHGIMVATIPRMGGMPPNGLSEGYRIEHNHIHHVMQVLGDGSGIYIVGSQRNGIVQSNVIHDVVSSKAGGPEFDGIYFDDYSKGFLVNANVVYDVSGRPLQFINSQRESFIIRDNYWHGTNAFVRATVGYAVSFAGDRSIDLPHQDSLEPSQMTVEARVNLYNLPSGADPSAWIVSKNFNEQTDGNYALLVSRANVGAYLNIGGGRDHCFSAWSSSEPVTPGNWHLLAMSYDDSNLTVYCDGKLVGSASVNRPRTVGNGPLLIGKRADGYNSSFPGMIQQVKIYDCALSPEEFASQTNRQDEDRYRSHVVLDWNPGDEYREVQGIFAEAGPEEPYRTRFLKPTPEMDNNNTMHTSQHE